MSESKDSSCEDAYSKSRIRVGRYTCLAVRKVRGEVADREDGEQRDIDLEPGEGAHNERRQVEATVEVDISQEHPEEKEGPLRLTRCRCCACGARASRASRRRTTRIREQAGSCPLRSRPRCA